METAGILRKKFEALRMHEEQQNQTPPPIKAQFRPKRFKVNLVFTTWFHENPILNSHKLLNQWENKTRLIGWFYALKMKISNLKKNNFFLSFIDYTLNSDKGFWSFDHYCCLLAFIGIFGLFWLLMNFYSLLRHRFIKNIQKVIT